MLFSEESMSATSTVITVLDLIVPLGHSAIDGTGLCGLLCFLVDWGRAYHVVLHSWVLADLPPEGFLVECFRAFRIVGRYFEVYYLTGYVRHMRHI